MYPKDILNTGPKFKWDEAAIERLKVAMKALDEKLEQEEKNRYVSQELLNRSYSI